MILKELEIKLQSGLLRIRNKRMGIFDRMQQLTKGKVEAEAKELSTAKPGDIIKGTITNLVKEDKNKKGGYGFITSPDLPFERIFFHWSGLDQKTLRFPDLKKRMRVEFKLQHDEFDGYKAIKIKVLL